MTNAKAWTLRLDVLPASFNSTRYSHWTKARKDHQALSLALVAGLVNAKVPRQPVDRIEASALLTFPTRRRRDSGNFRTPLEKALGDVLVVHGLLEDDTHDRFEFGYLRFAPEPGPPGTVITITAVTPN